MTNSNLASADGRVRFAMHFTVLTCMFSFFSIGILLPSVYTLTASFYESIDGLEFPIVTAVFTNTPPWVLTGIAIAICAAIVSVHRKGGKRVSLITNWLTVVVLGTITLLGVLNCVMPIVSVWQGLNG